MSGNNVQDEEMAVVPHSTSEGTLNTLEKLSSTHATVTENTVPTEQPKALDFPEGGLQAWLTVVGACLVQFCTFGYTNSFAVYQDYYVRVYLNNHTSSQVSWIGSVQLLLVLAAGVVTGRAFDRGYFYHLVIGGSLLFAFCLFMLSLAKPGQYYQIFLAQGLGAGIALGLTYVPSMGVIAHHFNKKRPMAMGIVASAASLGATLHPIMLNQLFHNPKVGFAKGVRASAGMNLGLLAIGCALMRTRLPPKRVAGMSMWAGLKSFAQDSAYVFTILGVALSTLGFYFPIFFIQLNSIARGLDPTFAFYSIVILNFASVFGRVIPTLVVRRLGAFNLLFCCVFCCSVMMFSLFGVKTIASTAIFAVLFGFFSGGLITLLAPVFSSLARDFSEIGARLGIAYTSIGLCGLVGTPISGALLTDNNIWWRPIVFSGVLVGSGAACVFIGRSIMARRKGTKIV